MGQDVDELESELVAAEARGRELLDNAPRAKSAKYDRATGRVNLELVNGCAYAFPARFIEDLQGATDDELEAIDIDGLGFNLHWPRLEVDLFVPALVSGVFGTRDWMAREFARRAGLSRSPAKVAAARSNGAKGGRPRKTARAEGGVVR